MNYFSFFDIPISPSIDEGALRKKFLRKSKEYHPDFYTLESEEKQAEILELSTLNNQAYKILKDFDKRLKHLLDIKEALQEEGQNKLPQDFLMEMMDINEGVMELQFDPSEEHYSRIQAEIKLLENTLNQSIEPILKSYDDTNVKEEELEMLKNYYLKKRYLLRVLENLSTFAPQ